MNRFWLTILLGCFAISAMPLHAQDNQALSVSGDSTLKSIIALQTRAIYEQREKWVFSLTKETPLGIEDAYGIELQASEFEEKLNRIIATAWTNVGKYSLEYYFADGALIFVYEAFEYFNTSAPKPSWRNFKGIASWERRSYFDGSAIGYRETLGDPHLDQSARSLIQAAEQMRNMLKKDLP